MFFAEPLMARAKSHSPASKRPSMTGAVFRNGTENSAAVRVNVGRSMEVRMAMTARVKLFFMAIVPMIVVFLKLYFSSTSRKTAEPGSLFSSKNKPFSS